MTTEHQPHSAAGDATTPPVPGRAGDVVPFRDAVRAWFAISLQTFGGPAGQIAVMQRTLVDEQALDRPAAVPARAELLHAAARPGGAAAGHLHRLAAQRHPRRPGRRRPVRAARACSRCWRCRRSTSRFGDHRPRSTALFAGLAPAVLAIVVQAVVRVGRRALGHPALVALAVAAFLALAVFAVPFPVVVAGRRRASAGRWAGGVPRVVPPGRQADGDDDGPPPLIPDDALHRERPVRRRALGSLLVGGLVVWCVPVAARGAAHRPRTACSPSRALFFSGAALVTFGGAYAVLAYVAQQAVEVYGWLAPRRDGPRPRPRRDDARTADHGRAVRRVRRRLPRPRRPRPVGRRRRSRSLLATWVTFVPCFLFIFLGAPYVERLRGNRPLVGRADRHHRRRRRRHRQPGGLLRGAHAVR